MTIAEPARGPGSALAGSDAVTPSWVDAMSRVSLEPAAVHRLGLDRRELHLRRAWPRSSDHVLLELQDEDGGLVAGQWMRQAGELGRIMAETADRCPGMPLHLVERAAGALLLQPGGADRTLSTLPRTVAEPGSRLLVHRPERRAVVRVGDAEHSRYVKVVPPNRVDRLAAPLLLLSERDLAFRVPPLLELRRGEGHLVLGHLTGTSLHELLADGTALISGVRAAGAALRSLHDLTGLDLPVYSGASVAQELRRRVRHLAAFDLPAWGGIDAVAEPIVCALEAPGSAHAPLHRDFHDKQIVVDDAGIGILDLDTLSMGEPALDVANLVVHLELRALQGLCSEAAAKEAAAAFLEAYAAPPATSDRLQAYADATRLRLGFLYAFRPLWRHLPPLLLARVGREIDARANLP